MEVQLCNLQGLLSTLVGTSKPKPRAKDFMNVKEASEATGLSQRSLRCYCNRGWIRYTKVGNSLIIHVDSLNDWINSKARKTTKEREEETIKNTEGWNKQGSKSQSAI